MSKAKKFSELFVFDLDGTLVHDLKDKKRGVPDHLLKTIHEVSKKAHVAVATGRRYKAAQPDLIVLPEMKFRIVHNGLVIKDEFEKTVFHDEQPLSRAVKIAEILESFGAPAFFVSDSHAHGVDFTYTEQTKNSAPEAKIVQSRPNQISRTISTWAEAFGRVDYPILEVATFGSFAAMSTLSQKIEGLLPAEVRQVLVKNVGHTPDTSVIEIFNRTSSKGHAVEWVRKALGVDHVTAVGDDGNDLEMLEFADIGVVMDHAEDRVKAAGDVHVSGPDGLTRYLQEWLDR